MEGRAAVPRRLVLRLCVNTALPKEIQGHKVFDFFSNRGCP